MAKPYHLPLLLGPLLLLAACGSSPQNRTAQRLDQRLEARLRPDIAANRAVVQRTPDGARVTLLDRSLFPNSVDALDNRESDPRANVIEALLDPSLMRVSFDDTSTLPIDQRDARVQNLTDYFRAARLDPTLVEPSTTEAPPTGPEGLGITIRVQCPRPSSSWSGYDEGRATPVCD